METLKGFVRVIGILFVVVTSATAMAKAIEPSSGPGSACPALGATAARDTYDSSGPENPLPDEPGVWWADQHRQWIEEPKESHCADPDWREPGIDEPEEPHDPDPDRHWHGPGIDEPEEPHYPDPDPDRHWPGPGFDEPEEPHYPDPDPDPDRHWPGPGIDEPEEPHYPDPDPDWREPGIHEPEGRDHPDWDWRDICDRHHLRSEPASPGIRYCSSEGSDGRDRGGACDPGRDPAKNGRGGPDHGGAGRCVFADWATSTEDPGAHDDVLFRIVQCTSCGVTFRLSPSNRCACDCSHLRCFCCPSCGMCHCGDLIFQDPEPSPPGDPDDLPWRSDKGMERQHDKSWQETHARSSLEERVMECRRARGPGVKPAATIAS
jgi:hypothetical protein